MGYKRSGSSEEVVLIAPSLVHHFAIAGGLHSELLTWYDSIEVVTKFSSFRSPLS